MMIRDDDIDPTNWADVMWAICTRCDPETSIDLVRGFLTSSLDPTVSPEKRAKGDFTMTKVLVNACKPYHWIKEFPLECRPSDVLRQKIKEKWSHIFTSAQPS